MNKEGEAIYENSPSATDLRDGPSERLVGLVLNGRWLIEMRLRRDYGDTGQSRSVCYRGICVESGKNYGKPAFVKAFDFRHDESEGDTEKLERNVREFNHERRTLEYCGNLSRVTKILDSGSAVVENQPVHYLVCEFASQSFRKHQPPGSVEVPAHERLRALRKISSALVQLHAAGVAHQDVKPSNAVHFDDGIIKLTDLGSSSCQHLPPPPHDEDTLVGQPNYAPLELLYTRERTFSWRSHRLGCDAYLLGNLIFTSFVGASLTMLVLYGLEEEQRPHQTRCSYEEILPELTKLHFELTNAFLVEFAPPTIARELTQLVTDLTNPDPTRRGVNSGLTSSDAQYDLHRCVSKLDFLAQKAKFQYAKKT